MLEFVCLPWSEVCSARVTSLLLLLLFSSSCGLLRLRPLPLCTRLSAPDCPLSWRLTRCHRVLPSQVSYELIGGVGVCIKYSKPFVCICKHTGIRIWRGCPVEVGYSTWPSALHCNPCPAPCSPGNVPHPTPGPLMDLHRAIITTTLPPWPALCLTAIIVF